ncbi:hypothetical protein GCM10010442_21590 [Kitasatospora kifunensis]
MAGQQPPRHILASDSVSTAVATGYTATIGTQSSYGPHRALIRPSSARNDSAAEFGQIQRDPERTAGRRPGGNGNARMWQV